MERVTDQLTLGRDRQIQGATQSKLCALPSSTCRRAVTFQLAQSVQPGCRGVDLRVQMFLCGAFPIEPATDGGRVDAERDESDTVRARAVRTWLLEGVLNANRLGARRLIGALACRHRIGRPGGFDRMIGQDSGDITNIGLQPAADSTSTNGRRDGRRVGIFARRRREANA